MIEQVSNALTFAAFFVASKLGSTGQTVKVDVYSPAGALLVSSGAATEVGGGLYAYALVAGSVTASGEYVAIFRSTDSALDQQHLAAMWSVGRAGIENLDATISTRLPTASYTAPLGSTATADAVLNATAASHDSTGTIGAVINDVSTINTNVDVAVSTRLASTGYTAPLGSTGTADAVLNATAASHDAAGTIGALINDVDVAVSTRLATTGYTAALGSTATADAVLGATAASHNSSGTIGALINDIADPLGYAVPGTYAAGTAGYKLGYLTPGQVTVLSPVSADGTTVDIVRGDSYASTDSRQLEWTEASGTSWPTLTGAGITFRARLASNDSLVLETTGTVITGTGSSKEVNVDLTAAQTGSTGLGQVIGGGVHNYEVVAQLGTSTAYRYVTLALGRINITREYTT